jgi:hypothetical protein
MHRVVCILLVSAIGCGCTPTGTRAAAPSTAGRGGGRPGAHPANGMIVAASSGRPVAAVDVDGPITAAVSDGRGGWFIAGGFTAVDGRPRASLAHVRADGSLDTGWRGPELGPPAALPFLSVARAGSRVLVAGAFDTSGRRRPGVVAVRASSGRLERGWKTPRVCFDGAWSVRAAAGRVWVATRCAAPPCLVAVAAASGRRRAWSAAITATGETGCVDGVALHGSEVFLTGGFTAVGGARRNGIAAVDAGDGRLVSGFAPRGPCARAGHAVAVAGGLAFVGGDACPVAAFGATGMQLWAWPRRANDATAALVAIAGRVYVGGAFARLGGVASHGLVALDARTGDPVASWHPPRGALLYSLTASDGRILIGAR